MDIAGDPEWGTTPIPRQGADGSDSGLLNCNTQDIYIRLCLMANSTSRPKREGAQVEARTTRAFPMLGPMVAFAAIAARSNPDLVQSVGGHPRRMPFRRVSTVARRASGPTLTPMNAPAAAGEVSSNGLSRQEGGCRSRATFGPIRVDGFRGSVSHPARQAAAMIQDRKQRDVCDNQGRTTP